MSNCYRSTMTTLSDKMAIQIAAGAAGLMGLVLIGSGAIWTAPRFTVRPVVKDSVVSFARPSAPVIPTSPGEFYWLPGMGSNHRPTG